MLRTLTLLLAFATPALTAGADPLETTERTFGKALTTNDTAALDKMLASEMIYTHSSAKTDTKATYVDSLKSGRLKYTQYEYEKIDGKMYGNTGVVLGVVHVQSVSGGATSESRLRILHVWVKNGDHWQLVAHQSTKLP